jgi:hypothetical protein
MRITNLTLEVFMATRYFALVLGIAFLLVGIMGFIPALLTHPDTHTHHLTVTGPGEGYLLGLFHVNLLHNLVHILFGVWGIFAYASMGAARTYSRVVAISYGLLTILGLIPPPFNTVFGLVPIHGHDVWLHAVIALAAAYFGWARVGVTAPHTAADTGTRTTTGTGTGAGPVI